MPKFNHYKTLQNIAATVVCVLSKWGLREDVCKNRPQAVKINIENSQKMPKRWARSLLRFLF
jgi:hypothetical protein